jgi:hypothetical protein
LNSLVLSSTCSLSKIVAFLAVQITQQAIIKISLKMGFPKFDLATITISRGGGWRFKSQLIGMVAQQA